MKYFGFINFILGIFAHPISAQLTRSTSYDSGYQRTNSVDSQLQGDPQEFNDSYPSYKNYQSQQQKITRLQNLKQQLPDNLDRKTLEQLFRYLKKKYNKKYTGKQEKVRFQNFLNNYSVIRKHNSKQNSYSLGLNKFFDMTDQQFQKDYLFPFDQKQLIKQAKKKTNLKKHVKKSDKIEDSTNRKNKLGQNNIEKNLKILNNEEDIQNRKQNNIQITYQERQVKIKMPQNKDDFDTKEQNYMIDIPDFSNRGNSLTISNSIKNTSK